MVFIWWNAFPCVQWEKRPGRPYEPISYITLAGTISKWMGNGSRSVDSPSAQMSSIACRSSWISLIGVWMLSGMAGAVPAERSFLPLGGDRLPDGEELAQRRVHVFLVLDGDGHEFVVVNFLAVDAHQRAGGIPALLD